MTGVTFIMDQLAGKRVELLKEISPKLTRLAVLWNPAHVDGELKEIETVSHALGIKLDLAQSATTGGCQTRPLPPWRKKIPKHCSRAVSTDVFGARVDCQLR